MNENIKFYAVTQEAVNILKLKKPFILKITWEKDKILARKPGGKEEKWPASLFEYIEPWITPIENIIWSFNGYKYKIKQYIYLDDHINPNDYFNCITYYKDFRYYQTNALEWLERFCDWKVINERVEWENFNSFAPNKAY